MIDEIKRRALQLQPQELNELDQILDANPRMTELLTKMFPELLALLDAQSPAAMGGQPQPGQQPSPQPAPQQGANGFYGAKA